MSQEEVISWLENHPGWHTTAKVAEGVRRANETNQRAYESLRRALKAHQIKRKIGKDRRARWSA